MRSIARKEGGDTDLTRDYEYTDWAAVDQFAHDMGTLVRSTRPAGAASATSGESTCSPQAEATPDAETQIDVHSSLFVALDQEHVVL